MLTILPRWPSDKVSTLSAGDPGFDSCLSRPNMPNELEIDTVGIVVCWLLNVPATCECISGTYLLRQLYVLPH